MQDEPDGLAWIDGDVVPLDRARLPLHDEGVVRGDGGFETVGVWDGRPFRFDDHLERLQASLRAIGLPAADEERLRAAAARLLALRGGRDGALRLYVTAGGAHVALLLPPPRRGPLRHLVPQPAPWIRPLGTYAPAGAKTMSYMPNMAATRAARRAGGDDALLCSTEGRVLEGPTFAVLWVAQGVVHAPDLALGVVDSISRRTVLEAAAARDVAVRTGRYELDALATASEVLVCSAVRELRAVTRVGDLELAGATPLAELLGAALRAARRGTSA